MHLFWLKSRKCDRLTMKVDLLFHFQREMKGIHGEVLAFQLENQTWGNNYSLQQQDTMDFRHIKSTLIKFSSTKLISSQKTKLPGRYLKVTETVFQLTDWIIFALEYIMEKQFGTPLWKCLFLPLSISINISKDSFGCDQSNLTLPQTHANLIISPVDAQILKVKLIHLLYSFSRRWNF